MDIDQERVADSGQTAPLEITPALLDNGGIGAESARVFAYLHANKHRFSIENVSRAFAHLAGKRRQPEDN